MLSHSIPPHPTRSYPPPPHTPPPSSPPFQHQEVDLGTMGFRQQLETIRRTNIYVGAHGAGLMHVMFLAEVRYHTYIRCLRIRPS